MARMFEFVFQLAGKINSSFSGTFTSAGSRLQKLSQQVASFNADLRELERAQKAGKITAEEYAAAYAKLSAQLQKASSKLSDQIQRTEKAAKIQEKISNFRDKMRGNLLGAVETGITLGAPVKAAIEFESAMADVRKVVDFETPQQFKQMGKDILNLSTRIPMAAKDLAQIVAAGGQAGIARNELLSFAESAAKMGVAFDITAEEAGQMMAEWRTAFGMNQKQVNTLADQINYLGNTTAASAPKISEVVRRIGPLGEVGGAAAGQIAALGATMVSVGIQEEIAATGIKNLILGLVAGESATKSQAEAYKKLGLNAKSMAKMMQKDAQGAILKVLEALKKLPKDKQAAVLTDLFGKESVGAIAPLLTRLDELKKNFKAVGDSSKYAGSMQKEFEARSATTENSLQLLRNQIQKLSISIGEILRPKVNDIAKLLAKGAEWVQRFAEKHPGLTRNVVLGTAAILGASVALTGLGYIISIIISPFATLYSWIIKYKTATEGATIAQRAWNAAKRAGQGLLNVGRLTLYHAKTLAITAATKAWTAAQWLWNAAMNAGKGLLSVGRLALYHAKTLAINVATRAWTAAQWLLNAALSANPIGLVVVAVAGLAAGLYLLYQRSEKARAIMNKLWEGLKSGAASAINFVIDKINYLIIKLNSFIDKLNKIPGINIGHIDTIGRVNFGKKKGTSAISTNALINEKLKLKGHAEGGIFTKPHIAWFAEKGPEAVVPLDGSARAKSIWASAGEALGVFSGSGPNITYAPVYYIYGGSDVEQHVRRAAKSAEDDFARRYKAFLRQERRLSYA
ncbi:phage tail tape measure protein [Carboxydothermus islandicus]|uniref:Phage tail tape measure protein n=1 Tax=Carboxydothermus islandicus TaxID=661089 RepID=A0A1L8D139_9THEO|nr:phage tail tape measure protein [Carboxydothermus islandicus]GAV24811.1 phage tail tape measure protein [Carboxydothermus islandicus]